MVPARAGARTRWLTLTLTLTPTLTLTLTLTLSLTQVGGVWGIHCGCLLPMAEDYSATVRLAHAAMVSHVASLLRS